MGAVSGRACQRSRARERKRNACEFLACPPAAGKGGFLTGFEGAFFGNGFPDEPEHRQDERLNDPEDDQAQGA